MNWEVIEWKFNSLSIAMLSMLVKGLYPIPSQKGPQVL